MDLFGRYESQTTKALRQIDSSKYPDTNKDIEANLVRLNQFMDYVSQYLQTMQKGVDQANKDPLSQMRDVVWNFGALLGGGELLYGIDLGDLQYYLPALGAMFGFDSDRPFPINLFEAVEHFFLGYVVPLDSFTVVIQDLIDGWLIAMGIDPDTVAAIHELLDAVGAITGDLFDFFDQVQGMLDILGISLDGLGPFGDIWHAITQLLGGLNLETLGDLVDPVLHALAPWIRQLAQLLQIVDQILDAFSGGLTDVQGILNFASMFTPFLDLMSGFTDPLAAWTELFTQAILPGGVTGGIPFFSQLTSMIPNLSNLGGAFDPQAGWNSVITDFLNPSGLLAAAGAAWDQLVDALNGDDGGDPDLASLAEMILTNLSPIDATNLFNFNTLFGSIGIGNLSAEPEELLDNAAFEDAISLQGGGIWTWDATKGKDTLGSAKVTAQGAYNQLVSNTVKVAEGDEITASVWAQWSGLTYTGTAPIRLEIVRLLYDPLTKTYANVGNIQIDPLATPGANQATWLQFIDTYTITSGVSHIALQLTVDTNATAGTVWFDAASMKKTQLMPTSFVNGLPDSLEGLWNGLGDASDDLLSLIETLAGGAGGLPSIVSRFTGIFTGGGIDASKLSNAVGTAPQNVIAGLPTDLGNLSTSVVANTTKVVDGWRKLIIGFLGADPNPLVDPTADDVQAAAEVMGEGVSTAQASNDTLSGFFHEPRVVPAYVGYGTDDVAFHHMQIDGTSTPTLGTVVLIPIKVQQDRLWEAVKFGIDDTTMTSLYVGLYAADQSNGNLTKVLDLGNVKPLLNIGYDQQIIPLAEPVGVQARELYYVGILQVGGTAAPMHRDSSTNNWATGLYPRWIGNIGPTGQTTLPGSISGASVASGVKYWAGMGDITAIVTPETKFYSDSFNRANSSSPGANWPLRAGTSLSILNNTMSCSQGLFDNGGFHTYSGRLQSLSQEVGMKIVNSGSWHNGSNGGSSTSGSFRMGLRGNGLGKMVLADLRWAWGGGPDGTFSKQARIFTANSYSECNSGGTQRASASSTWSTGTTSFIASGNIYQIWVGPQLQVQWTDSGNVFPIDSNFTEMGVGFFAAAQDPAVDDWYGKDL